MLVATLFTVNRWTPYCEQVTVMSATVATHSGSFKNETVPCSKTTVVIGRFCTIKIGYDCIGISPDKNIERNEHKCTRDFFTLLH
jgi:hypothetical protein